LKMKKFVFLLTCVFFFGCAPGQQSQSVSPDIVFETGKSREIVMHAIIRVVRNDGFAVAYSNEKKGIVVCKPREMLDGVLKEEIQGNPWNVQFNSSTFNHRIEFSANVNPNGVVKLKTLVMATEAADSVDGQESVKLARYYENKIKAALHRVVPRLI